MSGKNVAAARCSQSFDLIAVWPYGVLPRVTWRTNERRLIFQEFFRPQARRVSLELAHTVRGLDYNPIPTLQKLLFYVHQLTPSGLCL
jgi:hypothetical protein